MSFYSKTKAKKNIILFFKLVLSHLFRDFVTEADSCKLENGVKMESIWGLRIETFETKGLTHLRLESINNWK